jgi:hypothetical protein
MRRRSIATALAAVALTGLTASAGAATPALKKQFAPANTRIQQLGKDAAAATSRSRGWTWARRQKEWSALAKQTIAVEQTVGKLKGAKGILLVQQRNLQLALAKGAIDLSALATAARLHSKVKQSAAQKALVHDSPAITTARSALAKALGLGK